MQLNAIFKIECGETGGKCRIVAGERRGEGRKLRLCIITFLHNANNAMTKMIVRKVN